MNFIETRGNEKERDKKVTFSQAILNPLASFGGLYVPEKLPNLDNFIEENLNSNYIDVAFKLLKKFNIDIDDNDLKNALSLYKEFDNGAAVPVVKVKDDLFVMELYHGPTRAFKDMALQPFGSVLSVLAKAKNEKYLILAATSGDTGPAALNTFKNKENIQVVCLYPDGGTSDVQRLQMVTEDGKNLKVLGIKGTFDDAQNALKDLLASDKFKNSLKEHNISLSAANSVNFGRIIFQTIYHIWSYIQLVKTSEIKNGDKVYIVVPSGNFGNGLGCYYAKKMGLPVKKILITSNDNNVLSELINNGSYDLRDKKLIKTTSPAMDILKSSNVERILYDKFGAVRTKELMDSLSKNNFYQLTSNELIEFQKDFSATFSDETFVKKTIANYLNNDNYLLDPHTATCIKAYEDLKDDKDLKTIICSTAEWTKFSPTIANALSGKDLDDLDALKVISEKANIETPQVIDDVFKKDIVQKSIIEKEDIEKEILNFLK